MATLVDIAGSVLSQSTRRVEISAQNIANAATSGYKRRVAFEHLVTNGVDATQYNRKVDSSADFSLGKFVETGNAFDLAIVGEGFFVVRGPSGPVLTRQGQFERGADGRLLTPAGLALQAEGGGDVIAPDGVLTLGGDGVILANGEPVDRLAVVRVGDLAALAPVEGGGFSAPEADMLQIDRPVLRQGAYEASNVSTGQEMVAMMEALRRAESGQRLVTVYDDLMGRALTTFGQV
ncbi:flagellar hook-basal body protein [Caulobacter sp. DWR1-3-2b1]|uniref:flagellar hook-basal body protein n=1 Tax=Caulobacter sp. DWR1-3-2b1 TaxID=2804670 RepID=UPI003CEBB6F7